MAESLPLPKGYKRLGAFPIDEDSVFTTQAALDAYLAGGSSYAGQLVALVLDGENEVQVFKVNKDKTTGAVGSGGANIEVDANPTENSDNPVSSGGVFTELGKKAESNHSHEALSFDLNPSSGKVTLTYDANKMSNPYQITDTFLIEPATTGNKSGMTIELLLVADGVANHKPTFAGAHDNIYDNWDNTNGAVNVVYMKYLTNGKIRTDIRP